MLLPRYRADQPSATPTRRRSIHDKLRQIEDTDQAIADTITAGPSEASAWQQLRGIPCIARSVGGTQPGTDPLTEVLKSDRIKRYTRRDW